MSNLGPQFEQPELPGMPPAGKAPSSWEYKKRQISEGVGFSGQTRDRKIKEFSEKDPANPTPRAVTTHHKVGDQLKMFMTPREIEREWQPLDGDRHDGYALTSGTNDPRAGMHTERNERTDEVPNMYRGLRTATGAVTDAQGFKRRKTVFKRPSSTNPVRYGVDQAESTEDLWNRKYDEADEAPPSGQYDYEDEAVYRTPHGHETSAGGHYTLKTVPGHNTRPKMTGVDGDRGWYRTTKGRGGMKGAPSYNSRRRAETWVDHELVSEPSPHSTMVESIINEGVKSPIRLGLRMGSEAKPQMVGGHHRMAVARVHSPDQFAPVLYHEDIYEARSSNTQHSYKYT